MAGKRRTGRRTTSGRRKTTSRTTSRRKAGKRKAGKRKSTSRRTTKRKSTSRRSTSRRTTSKRKTGKGKRKSTSTAKKTKKKRASSTGKKTKKKASTGKKPGRKPLAGKIVLPTTTAGSKNIVMTVSDSLGDKINITGTTTPSGLIVNGSDTKKLADLVDTELNILKTERHTNTTLSPEEKTEIDEQIGIVETLKNKLTTAISNARQNPSAVVTAAAGAAATYYGYGPLFMTLLGMSSMNVQKANGPTYPVSTYEDKPGFIGPMSNKPGVASIVPPAYSNMTIPNIGTYKFNTVKTPWTPGTPVSGGYYNSQPQIIYI